MHAWSTFLFLLANNADSDEMTPSVAFHLGLHFIFAKYPFSGGGFQIKIFIKVNSIFQKILISFFSYF